MVEKLLDAAGDNPRQVQVQILTAPPDAPDVRTGWLVRPRYLVPLPVAQQAGVVDRPRK